MSNIKKLQLNIITHSEFISRAFICMLGKGRPYLMLVERVAKPFCLYTYYVKAIKYV